MDWLHPTGRPLQRLQGPFNASNAPGYSSSAIHLLNLSYAVRYAAWARRGIDLDAAENALLRNYTIELCRWTHDRDHPPADQTETQPASRQKGQPNVRR